MPASAEPARQRFAVADIGSNSIRLDIAEQIAPAQIDTPQTLAGSDTALCPAPFRIIETRRVGTRLARSLASTGLLDATSIAATYYALAQFQKIVAAHRVGAFRVIATCAVREAANGPEFCRLANAQLGFEVEVLSAADEAQLAWESVRRRGLLTGRRGVLADLGGGSTEIAIADEHQIEAIYGTTLGAVRFAEQFQTAEPLDELALAELLAAIDCELARGCQPPARRAACLIGAGGSFTSLGAMAAALHGRDPASSCEARVLRSEVEQLLDQLRRLPAAARARIPGLASDRADIMVPGLAIVARLMEWFGTAEVEIHRFGIRDGLLWKLLAASS